MLASLHKVTFVPCLVRIDLDAFTRLVMFLPLTLIGSTTGINVFSLATPLTLVPLALIASAVRGLEHTVAVRLTVAQVPFVTLAIGTFERILLPCIPFAHILLPWNDNRGHFDGLRSCEVYLLFVREDDVETVLNCFRCHGCKVLAQLLPVPILLGTRLVLFVQGPIPHCTLVHEPTFSYVIFGGSQYFRGLFVTMPKHGINQRLFRAFVSYGCFDRLILRVQEDRILTFMILACCPAQKLDPLSLTPRHKRQNEQEASIFVNGRVDDTVVMTSTALGSSYRDAPDLFGFASTSFFTFLPLFLFFFFVVIMLQLLGGSVHQFHELPGIPRIV
mmetsp:Transcript_79698/g.157880  ORF Transcript_79698/g.157880 Transcript_79698/m.157880 type:complete len:332 (-) Transcript_79698:2010-3005(-)